MNRPILTLALIALNPFLITFLYALIATKEHHR